MIDGPDPTTGHSIPRGDPDPSTPDTGPEEPRARRPDPNDPIRRRRPRDAARKLEVAIRREQVSTLLLTRTSYRQMAQLLGVSKSQIAEDVRTVLKDRQTRAAQHIGVFVTEQVAELDGLMRAWMPLALNPSDRVEEADKAVRNVLKLLERRSRLLGLDAPVRAELTGEGGGPIRIEGIDAARAEAQRALSEFVQRRSQQMAVEDGDVIDVEAAPNGQQGG